jgi:hypothetical protein
MTKKPLFWIILAFASALSIAFSWHFFAEAFPLLNIDISMSRAQAQEAAATRAAALKLAPADARSAVRFTTDTEAQHFIELEAGGKEVFFDLLKRDIYQALKWEVRFFREKDANLTTLYFTPQGKPYGFRRHHPEKDSGAALDAAVARQIAETAALRDWGIDLAPGKSPFALAEQSLEKRSGGRVDHVFVYERGDQRLGKNGEGRVRLTLEIAGDTLSQLRYAIKIPESFQRRYQEMRSANSVIATTATLAMGLLYLLGGCVVGLILLQRAHLVISRPAIKWAGWIALLQAAVVVNQIPSAWFEYDTAISANSFIARQALMAVVAFFASWALLAVSFMTAESLSRKAFGHHPQLWRLWTPGAANSRAVLGRTLGGYLWVGFDLAFIVLFYYLTQKYLHWWSPLESLVDPNILATPLPWLAPFAMSLQAGFWEECLFRAVPLAGAALLGDFVAVRYGGRLGGRKTWLAIGLVVQAVIFGAAHAAYPVQPAYARPVELFLPSLLWGLVYLRFGLLPGILFHFIFDLLLMSLPIFSTSAPGLGIDRVMVIAIGLVPLVMVLWSRVRTGAWQDLRHDLTNAGWTRPVLPQREAAHEVVHMQQHAWWPRVRIALPLLGIAGLIGWWTLVPSQQDGLPLYLERAHALATAESALRERGITLSQEWHRFAQVPEHARQAEEAFVWKEGGAAAYATLLGSYLPPPMWKVRHVRFTGDVAERAEEWNVYVENGNDGKAGKNVAPHVRRIEHAIPEARPGKSLAEAEARVIAQRVLRERFARDPAELREVSAVETRRPNRKDWRFEFSDSKNYPLTSGEARYLVNVSGDEVSDAGRYVYVPEEWRRHYRDRQSHLLIAKIAAGLLIALLAVSALVTAIIRSTHGEMDKRRFFLFSAVIFAVILAEVGNTWQSSAMALQTAQPLLDQVGMLAGGIVFGVLLLALSLGLLAGLGARGDSLGKLGSARFSSLLLPGMGLAAILAGLSAASSALTAHEMPRWESLEPLNRIFPVAGALVDGLPGSLIQLIAITFVLLLLRDFSAGFTRRRALTLAILVLAGFLQAMNATEFTTFLVTGLANGAIIALLYFAAARFEPKLVLIAVTGKIILSKIGIALIAPYPNAPLLTALYLATCCATAFWWMRTIEKRPGAASAAAPNITQEQI